MFGNGARALAKEALYKAQDADTKAAQALNAIAEHAKQCNEQRQAAAEWRGQVRTTLEGQNKDLDSIQKTLADSNKFLRGILLTAVMSLLGAISFVVYNELLRVMVTH